MDRLNPTVTRSGEVKSIANAHVISDTKEVRELN